MPTSNHLTFEDEWEHVEDGRPPVSTDQAIDASAAKEDCEFDIDLDRFLECRPEAETMREACASGDLTAVQSVFQTQLLDLPADERIDQNELGAGGLCEAIKRNDAVIAGYLLSDVMAMEQVHFGMATECRAYAVLQLFVDRNWDINTYSSRMDPPALS